MNASDSEDDDQDGAAPVKSRVRTSSSNLFSRVSGFVNEMRKKSPATIQKWVDSIAVDESEASSALKEIPEEEIPNCDSNEHKASEPSTSAPLTSATKDNLKVKFNEICSKLSLKSKKLEFKNLLARTSQKLSRESSMEQTNDEDLECTSTKHESELTSKDEINPETKTFATVQRRHIGLLGRSSSSDIPSPATSRRRLYDIGRSKTIGVEIEKELPTAESSSENLIYDADEEISITIPSIQTSPSSISNNMNHSLSNSQLTPGKVNLLPMRPLREHTVSEGHQSPQVQPKNPLLRDSSFQSDSSHCSSVESLLEARKPDAEAILINLGFGPANGSDDVVSKIPKRFLKPSQVKGVDTDTFLRNQHLSKNIHENSVLGYRGLLGDSHVPSHIVKAIMQRFSANEIQRMSSLESIDCRNPRSNFRVLANTVLAQRHFMK